MVAPMSTRKRWNRRRKVGIVLLLAYAAVMTFGGCADRLLLFPSKNPIDAGRAQRFTVDSDGRLLEIWSARSPAVAVDAEPEAFVLEFGGNATRAEQITQYVADRWARFPVEVWVMNYPGYGGSEGSAKLSLIAPSASAAYDRSEEH